MGGLFGGGGGGAPAPQPTPIAPSIDDASLKIDEARRRRLRRGRSATELVQREQQTSTAARELTGN